MSISKDVIKQCLISKQREVDEAVLVERPIDFEENGNYVTKVSHPLKHCLFSFPFACRPPYSLTFNT